MALVPVLAAPASAAEEPAAAIQGRQRAATSNVEWDVREAGHPSLGNIRFAYMKRALETKVGGTSVYTRAYLSCQKDKRSFAIELTNAMGPADPGGLKPANDPRLYCMRPEGDKLLKEEILATWEVNQKIGDVLARGLRGFPLRECVAISVQQEVVMPEGAAQKTGKIEFEILPYNRELDTVFVTCGERAAYGPAPPPVIAAATTAAPATPAEPPAPAKAAPAKTAPVKASPPAAKAKPTPPPPPPKVSAAPVTVADAAPPTQTQTPAPTGEWREARTVPTSKTNVRAGPSIQTPIVTELFPGSVLMIQSTGSDWYRVRPSRGNAFEGYIRQDRLVIK